MVVIVELLRRLFASGIRFRNSLMRLAIGARRSILKAHTIGSIVRGIYGPALRRALAAEAVHLPIEFPKQKGSNAVR
jgi:hypothetical protein